MLPPSPQTEKLEIGGFYTRKQGLGQQLYILKESFAGYYECLALFYYTNGNKKAVWTKVHPSDVFPTPEDRIDLEFWALEIMKS